MDNWKSTETELPICNDKWGDSDHCLCYAEYQPPFVAWYNDKTENWTVSHHYAKSIPAKVDFWKKLIYEEPKNNHTQQETDIWDEIIGV